MIDCPNKGGAVILCCYLSRFYSRDPAISGSFRRRTGYPLQDPRLKATHITRRRGMMGVNLLLVDPHDFQRPATVV